MVDIHFHLLPGLDDGPASIELSVEMAQLAAADGTTHIVATPHASARYPFHHELIQERLEQVRGLVGDTVTIVTGCDFHLSYENLQDVRVHPDRYTINRRGYLLVEFADYSIPPAIDQTFHELQLAGITPVVTHPERNRLLRRHTDWLDRWTSRGCAVQVTAGAFLGRFGPDVQQVVEQWLATDRLHFVASDAHNVTSRPPGLGEARRRIAELRGERVAEALVTHNPMAAIEGQPLPYSPEPTGAVNLAPRRRKRFWFF
ncbi:MAG TPA: CpsB/CapC family capsule biosynthesis tyrosine phosphatase [Candidatus Acidoferrales bacterium]|nr:CpsB/CapC family capsule biosynthesis tyrosine phosphatase [Candidatus Acidoferrales bacterium]